MDDVLRLFSDPVGIFALGLIGFSMVFFIQNLFRKELSPDEWVKKRDDRLPTLKHLINDLGKYVRITHKVSRNPSLYNAHDYGLNNKPSIVIFLNIKNSNNKYLALKNDGKVSALRENIVMTSNQLADGKLIKLTDKVIEQEHKARSQKIAIRLYRKEYPHTRRNEGKLLKAENIIRFGKELKRLYKHIEDMKGGKGIEL